MKPESSFIPSPFGPVKISTSSGSNPEVIIEFVKQTPKSLSNKQSKSAFHKNVKIKIFKYLQGATDSVTVNMDPSLTPFQQKVLEAVCNIPYGQTASYATIAKFIGHPKAVRAVAPAIAKNQALILIPCHRVIRSDGSVGKYRAGPKVKQSLLDFEKSNLNPHKSRHRP